MIKTYEDYRGDVKGWASLGPLIEGAPVERGWEQVCHKPWNVGTRSHLI